MLNKNRDFYFWLFIFFFLCGIGIPVQLIYSTVDHNSAPSNGYDENNQKFLRGGPGGAVFSKSAPPGRDDMDSDGFPDVVELIDETDRMRFRRWFVAIAESQFYAIHSQWPKIRRDCTGLICFAYKEALKKHDDQWLKGFRYLSNPAIPDITVFCYPELPLIKSNLFRTVPGPFKTKDLEERTFQPTATAQVLMNYNCRYLGNRLDESILEGDLLFFRYFVDENMVFHTMILVKNLYGKSTGEPDGIVVYHTGPDGSDFGEVRKCRISTLNRHPDDVWHVKPNNPHFLGFYRFNILDYQFLLPPAARGALFEKTAPLDPPQKLLINLNTNSVIENRRRTHS